MELRHLRYFCAAATELHFGRAAAQVHTTQSALSQQIQKLERELGAQLFDRSQRAVRLTEAGRVLLEQARRVLAEAEEAENLLRCIGQGTIGQLRIGFTGPALYHAMPRGLAIYRARMPQVRLSLHELCTAEQEQWLLEGRLDIGFLHPPLAATGLTRLMLGEEPYGVAVHSDSPLAKHASVAWAQLADQDFILFNRSLGPTLFDSIIARCRAAGFSPRIVTEAGPYMTVIGLVAAGVGIGLVPGSLRHTIPPQVVFLSLANDPPLLQHGIAYRKTAALKPVVKAFIDNAQSIVGGVN